MSASQAEREPWFRRVMAWGRAVVKLGAAPDPKSLINMLTKSIREAMRHGGVVISDEDMTIDGGFDSHTPVTDEEYESIAQRHQDRGLPVPPRHVVEMGPLGPDQVVAAWAGSSAWDVGDAEEEPRVQHLRALIEWWIDWWSTDAGTRPTIREIDEAIYSARRMLRRAPADERVSQARSEPSSLPENSERSERSP